MYMTKMLLQHFISNNHFTYGNITIHLRFLEVIFSNRKLLIFPRFGASDSHRKEDFLAYDFYTSKCK